jgi:hypothetical protein
LRVVVTVLAQIFHALSRMCAQIIEPPENNRFSWADFGACGNESAFLSIVAESALECATGVGQRRRPAIDHAERTRDDAIAAAVANIILYKNRSGFGANN